MHHKDGTTCTYHPSGVININLYIIMRKYKLVINTWVLSDPKPITLHEEIIHSEEDRAEMIETFRHEANDRLGNGETITFISHLWNYTFKTPSGEEYNLYMFEKNI